jgi:hypothetical protein
MFADLGSQSPEAIRSPEDIYLEAQIPNLRVTLLHLGLAKIPVKKEINLRSSQDFIDQKILALGTADENNVAIAAASADALGPEAGVIIIAPTREGSGILEDKETGILYSDTFWIFEDGQFQLTRTTSPVQIDDLHTVYDDKRDIARLAGKQEQRAALHELSNNKHKTREALEKAGIRIPRGVLLRNWTNHTARDISEFSQKSVDGVVLKDLYGAHGEGVVMFDREDLDGMFDFAGTVLEEFGGSLIMEERIVPLVTPEQKAKFEIPEDQELDWNFRVLVTADTQFPEYLDSEVRYKVKNNHPVNITYEDEEERASAALTNEFLLDPGLIDDVHETAIAATRVVCQEALQPGEQTPPGELVGVDLMVDRQGRVYVIEVNAGGPVGGIATLTRLHKAPLNFLREKFLPGWEAQVEKGERRVVLDAKVIDRVRHSSVDELLLFDSLAAGGYEFESHRAGIRYQLRNLDVTNMADGLRLAGSTYITDEERERILFSDTEDKRKEQLRNLNIFK